ncbi:MAG: hypothetical protein RMK65_00100 [Anaerolineae bacterium]|nr:hypothetical protein [Anaerolineae bacterium]MCX8066285.1 hypothetical protein [Anaerolineae bacterium]MDW7990559.1 hypothetical protein [Anaerolineae bacterium]
MNSPITVAHILLAPLGPIVLVVLLFVGDLYLNLSRRLGEVTRMPPFYRRFWIGGAFIALAALVQVLRTSAYLSQGERVRVLLSPEFSLIAFHLPFLIGVLISIQTAWRYWSWLVVREK